MAVGEGGRHRLEFRDPAGVAGHRTTGFAAWGIDRGGGSLHEKYRFVPGRSVKTGRTKAPGHGRPAAGQPVVPRRRLAEMLDAGTGRAVTLVCAGAGWGKSTLVAWWAEARAQTGPVAWLTLHARHNEPGEFWSDLVAALRIAGAIPCGFAERPGPQAVRRALSGAEAPPAPAPVVLVLDDFHELNDARVVAGLAGLLDEPPATLRLVMISRSEPSLPLHRFRAAGDLTEIRARHLAFRAPEAAGLPALSDRGMPVEELIGLLDRTEGWVAGLRLLATNGENRAVSDYLLHEVVAPLPAKIRQFLVRTSLPDEISGPLADALTGETHSRRILERLETANAFVTRIESRPGWFRYHPLLRDALRHEIALDGPRVEAELHLLAAQWYAREEFTLAALRHAAAARDWLYVAHLAVDRAMVRVLSGERAEFVGVLRQIPAEQYAKSAELALCGLAVRYHSGDRAGVAGMIRLARSLAEERPGTPIATEITLRLVETGIRYWQPGDMPTLVTAASETLRRLAAFRLDEVPSLLHYRAVALDEKGAGLLWCDRPDHADRYLWAAATAARGIGSTLVEISALSHLGLLVLLQGSLREAAEFVTKALDLARRYDFEGSAQIAIAHLTMALVHLEDDRPEEAQESLRRGVHAGGEEPAAATALLTTLVRAKMLLTADEPAAARTILRQAREEAPQTLVAPVIDRWLWLAESEADLALGGARDVVVRYDRPAPRGLFTAAEQVCLARAYLAVADHVAAERLLARARAGPDHVAAVTAWIATAFAADAEGHGNRSLDALSTAVHAAERQGIRRPFRTFDQRRMAVLFDRRRWVEEHAERRRDGYAADPVPVSDVLSERERDVLRYLPTVLTAGEIATNLNISINTVKAHMRSIYRKLGAARRREAVVQARRLGLL